MFCFCKHGLNSIIFIVYCVSFFCIVTMFVVVMKYSLGSFDSVVGYLSECEQP